MVEKSDKDDKINASKTPRQLIRVEDDSQQAETPKTGCC